MEEQDKQELLGFEGLSDPRPVEYATIMMPRHAASEEDADMTRRVNALKAELVSLCGEGLAVGVIEAALGLAAAVVTARLVYQESDFKKPIVADEAVFFFVERACEIIRGDIPVSLHPLNS